MARITILALVLLLLGGLAGSAAAAQPQQPRLALIARDVQKFTTDGQRYTQPLPSRAPRTSACP
jgi:hypothetical protein